MFVKSDYLHAKVTFSHEECEALGRWLHARLCGGAMLASDEAIVRDFCAEMLEHTDKIGERLDAIKESEKAVDLSQAVQVCADVDLNQIKELFKKAREPQSAADGVDVATFADIATFSDRIRQANVVIDLDEQIGIYQVRRD